MRILVAGRQGMLAQDLVPSLEASGFEVMNRGRRRGRPELDIDDFFYLCTGVYVPQDEYGVTWDDGLLKIDWPISVPDLSEKDRQYPALDSIPKEYLPLCEACP